MASEKIVIQADPDLANLIPEFLKNRYKDVLAIKEAIAQGDMETIRVIGHSMKGTGGGYGFQAITELGAALEQAAKLLDLKSIKRTVRSLEDYLERIEVVYN